MKKIALITLTALLGLGLAVPAMAATTLEVGGKVKMEGYYIEAGNGNARGVSWGSGNGPVAYMKMETKLFLDFIVAKGLVLETEFVGAKKTWGRNQSAGDLAMTRALIVWASPVGKFKIGHYTDDPSGMSSFGLMKSKVEAKRYFTGGKDAKDVVKYETKLGAAKIKVGYEKKDEEDNVTTVADQDRDSYEVEGEFGWKSGKAAARLKMERDARGGKDPYSLYTVRGRAAQSFGGFTVGGEVNYKFGDMNNGVSAAGLWYYLEAFYANKRMNTGVAFASTYDDTNSDTENKDTDTLGQNFRPLYAAFTKDAGLLYDQRGLNVLTAWFDFNLVKSMWLHVGAGIITANTNASIASDEVGSEIDLGLAISLAKALTLYMEAGYFMPGAYYGSSLDNILFAHMLLKLSM